MSEDLNHAFFSPVGLEVARLREENARLSEMLAERTHQHAVQIQNAQRLQAIVDKLPTTVDGLPVYPGMTVYQADGSPAIASGYDHHGDWWEVELEHDGFLPSDELWSTREAALAARKKP